MELRPQALTDRSGEAHQFARQLVQRVAQAVAQACPWKQGPHTADGAVEAIGEGTPHAIRGLLFQGRLLKYAVGLGEGGRTLRVTVAQVPDHPATDDRGQIDPVGETATVFFIGQDIRRQRQATASQHRDEAVLAKRTDQAIEGHGGEVADGRAQLQAEPAMGCQQGVLGRFGSHLAVTQDEVGQDGEHRFASRALNAPDGQPTQADSHIMGVAGQTTAAGTGRFVGELKPQREDEGEDKLDKCFAIVNQLKIGGFILEIDGDRAVLPWRFGSLSHVSPQVIRSRMLMRHDEGNAWKDQGNWDGLTAVPLNAMECEVDQMNSL